MAVNKRDIIMRYAVVVFFLAFIGICVLIKAGIIMFKERGYWQDVAARFVRENVSVPSTRGNILSSDAWNNTSTGFVGTSTTLSRPLCCLLQATLTARTQSRESLLSDLSETHQLPAV